MISEIFQWIFCPNNQILIQKQHRNTLHTWHTVRRIATAATPTMTIEKLQLDFNSVRVGFTAAIKLDSQQN